MTATLRQFQVICLNKNNDAIKVLRIPALSTTEAKEAIRKHFAFVGAPRGTVAFRVVPLDR